jgi:hypothetical protein
MQRSRSFEKHYGNSGRERNNGRTVHKPTKRSTSKDKVKALEGLTNLCGNKHTCDVLYEKPEGYDRVRCDKCHKYITVMKGFIHCPTCGEDYCCDCGYTRSNMSDKKI